MRSSRHRLVTPSTWQVQLAMCLPPLRRAAYLRCCAPNQPFRVTMAFSELETKRVEKAVGKFVEGHRPPPHSRHELDLSYRINGQSVEIFEVRPRWRGAPG